MPFALENVANQLEAKIRAHRPLELPATWAGELVFPNYGGLALTNVPHSIAGLLGVTLPESVPLENAVWGGQMPGGIQRVLVFLIDGVGYQWLRDCMNDDPELADIVADLTGGNGPVPITSIAPSTTAVALPTLWTGRSPVAHGMFGTTMFLREFWELGNMLAYSPAVGQHPENTFEAWGLPPEQFIPVPGLSEQLAAQGIETHLVLHYQLSGTGLSRILHRGVQHRHVHMGYRDMWLGLGEVLRQTAGQRCVVNAYWPNVDSLSHMYGADNPITRGEIKQLLASLRTVLADSAVQDGQTMVMILADHGHYDALKAIRVPEDANTAPIHQAMRAGMGGEMRFAHVYVREGYMQQVIDTVEREFADCVTWVRGDEAIAKGLFGTEAPYAETPHRVGDIVLIARLGWRVVNQTINFKAVSLHGGLSDREMLVPLLWNRM